MTRAHDDAARLAATARLLARSPNVPDDAARQGALHVADVLDLQAGVLAASLPSPNPSPSAVSGPASESPSGAPSSPAVMVIGLSASAAARTSDLPSVDGPTAALLASVAAGQALEAAHYAHAAGTTPATLPSNGSSAAGRTSAGPAPSSVGPSTCSAQSQSQSQSATISAPPATPPRPVSSTTSGGAVSEQAAFTAVEQAEQAAVWTYTVLAARTDAAARASHLAAAALHEAQLRSLDAMAERVCAGLPSPDAGFGLPADAGTAAQLVALEQSVTATWSGLVSATAPAVRATAAEGLLWAARRGDAVGAQSTLAASAFPGHAAGRAEAEVLGGAAGRAPSATSAGSAGSATSTAPSSGH